MRHLHLRRLIAFSPLLCRRPPAPPSASQALRATTPHNAAAWQPCRQCQRRTLVAAPRPGSGPIMERRADRELPSIKPPHPWLKTLPIFAVIIAAATLGIFNYQKSSSSVVSSTLFALRTHPRAREALGEQIYFKHKFPWIWGEMNQLHGRINIRYSVKGTKDSGMMTFRSMRKRRDGKFVTEEWSLETSDGQKIQLLERDNPDPWDKPVVS